MNTLIACILVAVCAREVFSSQYHGPTATPVVLHNGYLADTHEVVAARTAHLAQLEKGYGHGYSHDDHYHLKYHGPTTIPHVLHDGHIADTHEVAAAKAEHYAAVAKAKAHGGYVHDYSGQYASGYEGYHGYTHHAASYHGPLAKPVVLHNGYLADTHEVAAAKSEHYATVAKAKAHGGYGHDYSGQYASGYEGYHGYSQHAAPYHGPLAKPVVLHNGYLADTHEVAAAKHRHLEALHSGHHGSHYSYHY